MSEYQYYEFQAIDRPLTSEEKKEISRISSRTEATSTRAVFTYSYRDFPRNPKVILRHYFDAMVYLSNWGSRRLAFRFPASVIDLDTIQAFCVDNHIEVESDGEYVILDLNYYDEEGGGDWIEGEGWLSSLASLRGDLLQGDYRVLYLMWLKLALLDMEYAGDEEGYEDEYEDDAYFGIVPGTLEPPVPAGLKTLTGPLREFMDFFEIGQVVAEVAARTSSTEKAMEETDLPDLIDRLSEEEKTAFLRRLAENEPHLGVQFQSRLRKFAAGKEPSGPDLSTRRTARELHEATKERYNQLEKERKKAAEAARLKRLEEVAKVEPQLWDDVFALIAEKKSKSYEQAVKILKELRDLAKHRGEEPAFKRRIESIREQYPTLSALKRQIEKARF